MQDDFKSGFVSILGKPNVGKSTLMNALMGEKLSIMTHKAQTTRHRIFGILNGENYQIVYSDTPGVIDPQYRLQQQMMRFVQDALEDADLILYLVELQEKFQPSEILSFLGKTDIPVLFVINKIDQAKGTQLQDKLQHWQEHLPKIEMLTVSALAKINLESLFERILELLPPHPPYFPDDSLSDRPERFFAAEMIREQIFMHYKQEIPYSSEVEIESFKEAEDIIRIRALIYVERNTQKGILIGKRGESLKKVGTGARLEMEQFFQKKVHLETYVKVEKDWRSNERSLKKFGYQH